MDSSISHDPFAPEGTTDVTNPISVEFDAARWERAGASEDEIADLRASFDESTVEERAGMNGWMSSVSDSDLADWLAGDEAGHKSIEDLTAGRDATAAELEAAPSGRGIAERKRAAEAAQSALDAVLSPANSDDGESDDSGPNDGEDADDVED
jgi:hypothetical protein